MKKTAYVLGVPGFCVAPESFTTNQARGLQVRAYFGVGMSIHLLAAGWVGGLASGWAAVNECNLDYKSTGVYIHSYMDKDTVKILVFEVYSSLV